MISSFGKLFARVITTRLYGLSVGFLTRRWYTEGVHHSSPDNTVLTHLAKRSSSPLEATDDSFDQVYATRRGD